MPERLFPQLGIVLGIEGPVPFHLQVILKHQSPQISLVFPAGHASRECHPQNECYQY